LHTEQRFARLSVVAKEKAAAARATLDRESIMAIRTQLADSQARLDLIFFVRSTELSRDPTAQRLGRALEHVIAALAELDRVVRPNLSGTAPP
jgi:glycine cleavage system regulatory protein